MSRGRLGVELREQLGKQLVVDGWRLADRPTPAEPAPFGLGHLGTFARPMMGEFEAVLALGWEWESGDEPANVVAYLGVGYAPLTSAARSLVEDEVGGILLRGRRQAVALVDRDEVAVGVRDVSAFVYRHLPDVAKACDVVEIVALLNSGRAVVLTADTIGDLALSDDEDEEGVASDWQDGGEQDMADLIERVLATEVVALLHFVNGRYEDARRTVATALDGVADDEMGGRLRRFARQLEGAMADGGKLPAADAQQWPAPGRARTRAEHLGDVARTAASAALSQHDAIEATRKVAEDISGPELRAYLEREMKRRDVSVTADDLDELARIIDAERRSGKVGVARHLLRRLREPGSAHRGRRYTRAGNVETRRGDAALARLARPETACFPVRGPIQRTVLVGLEADAVAWLRDIATALEMQAGDALSLEVWFDSPRDDNGAQARLDVYVGRRHVGHVGAEIAALLSPAVKSAAARGEHPWAQGRLRRAGGDAGIELELGLPEERR